MLHWFAHKAYFRGIELRPVKSRDPVNRGTVTRGFTVLRSDPLSFLYCHFQSDKKNTDPILDNSSFCRALHYDKRCAKNRVGAGHWKLLMRYSMLYSLLLPWSLLCKHWRYNLSNIPTFWQFFTPPLNPADEFSATLPPWSTYLYTQKTLFHIFKHEFFK